MTSWFTPVCLPRLGEIVALVLFLNRFQAPKQMVAPKKNCRHSLGNTRVDTCQGLRETMMKSGRESPADVACANISMRIRDLGDWRGEALAQVRKLIHQAIPDVVEEWKWRGVPVWSSDGIVCTGETYKEIVKLTFARGASLSDPKKLFNSSLQGNARRAIDLRQGSKLNQTAFKHLARAAAAANAAALADRAARKRAKK